MLTKPMTVVGIDPSFSGTGLVLLRLQPRGGLIECDVLNRTTVRVPPSTTVDGKTVPRLMQDRVGPLYRNVCEFLATAVQDGAKQIVVEDPTDFKAIQYGRRSGTGKQTKDALRSPRSIATLGISYGIVLLAATQYTIPIPLASVPSNIWYPRLYGRKLKHEAARSYLRQRYPNVESCNDDETFAAGVACWWAWNFAS